jgi:hypothetical protein
MGVPFSCHFRGLNSENVVLLAPDSSSGLIHPWISSVSPRERLRTKYHKGDHSRTRLTEGELDAQMIGLFDRLRVEDSEFRQTFRQELRKATNWDQRISAERAKSWPAPRKLVQKL